MGTADRIERDRLAKRTRILDAARELFVERGVEAVTLREIAQRIEYSTTAIYVQFKDKHDLIEQMIAEDFAAFAGALGACAKIVDPIERLRELGRSYLEFALAMPRHYQLLFLTPARPVHAHDEAIADSPAGIEGYSLLLATVEECLRTKRLRPELGDAHALAQVIWGSVHGIASLLIVKGAQVAFGWKPAAVLDALNYDLLIHGMLREPAPQPRRRRLASRE
ncbi:MAG: TetR/AcrR family transcriptional regulator [Kofleriaceae bacterium]